MSSSNLALSARLSDKPSSLDGVGRWNNENRARHSYSEKIDTALYNEVVWDCNLLAYSGVIGGWNPGLERDHLCAKSSSIFMAGKATVRDDAPLNPLILS